MLTIQVKPVKEQPQGVTMGQPSGDGKLGRTGLRIAAALGVIIATLLFHAWVSAGFPLAITRLTTADEICSLESRLAASADRQWLVTTWIQGWRIGDGCKSQGDAVMRWTTEGAGQSGWSESIAFPLPSGACAVHTDAAVNGSEAHVAVTYWAPCYEADADSGILYFRCNLADGSCTTGETAVAISGALDRRLSDVRVVIGQDAQPHIVYALGTSGLAAGDVMYTHREGTWQSPVKVSTGDKYGGFYRPVAAASNGRIHIAWERHRDRYDNINRIHYRGDVQYAFCEEDSGDCVSPITYWYPPNLAIDSTYPIPDIAARGNRVVMVWNVCADVVPDPPCEEFYLLYARSDANGESYSWVFTPLEVGSDIPASSIDLLSTRFYAGTDNSDRGTTLPSSYATYARPVVDLDDEGLPFVAWQVAVDGGYVISTTHATSASAQNFTWSTDANWQVGDGTRNLVHPNILVPDPNLEDHGLHVLFSEAWLETSGSQEVSRAHVNYDYYGNRQPILETASVAGPNALPGDRAVVLRAQVRDLQGNAVTDIPVTYRTDHGGFSLDGMSSTVTQRTSSADGWTEAMLYANLPGTASVTAWIDSTANGQLDSGEPSATFSTSWTADPEPALAIGTNWAIAGDLMTATLTSHYYEDPEFPGAPAGYAVYWCPIAGAGGSPSRVAGPLNVNAETWQRSNLVISVPEEADGTYYLESRKSDESTPCANNDGRMAVSANLAVSPPENPAPPPDQGSDPDDPNPWLLLSENRPRPGDTMQTTLKDHAAASYEIWWCPATSTAIGSGQKVASATISSYGDEPNVNLDVPLGVAGLYRLESHLTGGACGSTSTVQGKSSLVDPLSQVFLPLVVRGR